MVAACSPSRQDTTITHMCIHTRMHICTYTYVHMYNICTYTYVRTYVHTHTYICVQWTTATLSLHVDTVYMQTHTQWHKTVKKMVLKHTYILYIRMHVHTCMQTHVRTYVRVQRMRMYTYDNSLSIHMLLYICTYVHACVYVRMYIHTCMFKGWRPYLCRYID